MLFALIYNLESSGNKESGDQYHHDDKIMMKMKANQPPIDTKNNIYGLCDMGMQTRDYKFRILLINSIT